MARYIKADALCEALMTRWNTADENAEKLISEVMADIVTPIVVSMPTADVVEVVRCKDCKHKPYRDNDGFVSPEVGKCPCINGDDSFYSWIPEDDWFCADAERREDGTT